MSPAGTPPGGARRGGAAGGAGETAEAATGEGGQRHRKRGGGRRHQATTLVDWVLLALLVGAAGWLGWQGFKLVRADFQMMEARATVLAWAGGRAKWTIPDWVKARAALLRALETTPENAAIHDQLGILYSVRGRDAVRSPDTQQAFYREAARHQRASLALRPRHAWAWAALTQSLEVIEPRSDAMWSAWRSAYAYGPHEPAVQASLLEIGLRAWPAAPMDVKEAMKAIYASAVPSVRNPTDALAQRLRLEGWI